MLHIKRRHLAAIFKAPTSLESYSEKSHVLYMVMLSETGISMHSIELATWNPTGKGLGGKIAFCMNSAGFPSALLDWFKCWPWRDPGLWNQGTQVFYTGQTQLCSLACSSPTTLIHTLPFPSSVVVHLDCALDSLGQLQNTPMPGSHARPIEPEPQGCSPSLSMLKEFSTDTEVQPRLRNVAPY